MTDEKEPRDEVAIAELDQRYASLRLAAPDGLARVRASIERMGILSPVLVATAVEATRVVVVDGHKRATRAGHCAQTPSGSPPGSCRRRVKDADACCSTLRLRGTGPRSCRNPPTRS